MMKHIILFFAVSTVFLAIGHGKASSDTGLKIAPDVEKRAMSLVAKNMSTSSLYDGLADWEKVVLNKLVLASQYMEQLFWQQVDPEGKLIFDQLKNAGTVKEKAARCMMSPNYGRWDRFKEFETFVGTQPKPAGSYVYPTDLTKAELDEYISRHPDQRDSLLNPFTVVRRQGDQLITVPYHKAYAQYLEPAAALIAEASELSKNASLKTYLHLQAQALLSDQYFDADMAWLDLDSNIDLSIGPHETYDDQLAGVKTFYKANVMIVDKKAGARLDKFKETAPELQRNLPVEAKFKPDQTGTMMPLVVTDDIYRSGQGRSFMEAVAFSLPNDPKVWKAKGAKKVMMGNYLQTRQTTILKPLAKIVLAESVNSQINYPNYFSWVLMHEITHTLGPREAIVDGKSIHLREALGEYYSPIEEGKADIGGLYNIPYLIEKKVINGTLTSYYGGYLSEGLRSIRFGMGSAYGVIRSAAWNFFVEKGGLIFDSANNCFLLDTDKMTEAVKELTTTFLEIEGNGDKAAAEAFIKKYSGVRPELKQILDKAEASVPLEFFPIYPETQT